MWRRGDIRWEKGGTYFVGFLWGTMSNVGIVCVGMWCLWGFVCLGMGDGWMGACSTIGFLGRGQLRGSILMLLHSNPLTYEHNTYKYALH